MIFITKISLTC